MNTVTTDINSFTLTRYSAQELKDALAIVEGKKNAGREAYKKLVAETAPKAMFMLYATSKMISNAKTETFRFVETILDLKNQMYGLKEKQMSHTFSINKEEFTDGVEIIVAAFKPARSSWYIET